MTDAVPQHDIAPPSAAARAQGQVWCPKLRVYTPRVWVADHLADVHGVNPNMIIHAYGGRGARRGR